MKAVHFSVALHPQKPSGLLGMGNPGQPARLSHNYWALIKLLLRLTLIFLATVHFFLVLDFTFLLPISTGFLVGFFPLTSHLCVCNIVCTVQKPQWYIGNPLSNSLYPCAILLKLIQAMSRKDLQFSTVIDFCFPGSDFSHFTKCSFQILCSVFLLHPLHFMFLFCFCFFNGRTSKTNDLVPNKKL